LKCHAVCLNYPDAIVIGADQVADRDGEVVNKMGDHAGAVLDLTRSAGKRLVFHSAVCVRYQDRTIEFVNQTVCQFRKLSEQEIIAYVDAEQPWDCAGSIKTEALGLLLLDRMESNDPTGVIGLPLLQLRQALSELGLFE
jgi:septum formation protein